LGKGLDASTKVTTEEASANTTEDTSVHSDWTEVEATSKVFGSNEEVRQLWSRWTLGKRIGMSTQDCQSKYPSTWGNATETIINATSAKAAETRHGSSHHDCY